MSNFYPLEVVGRGSETQLQMDYWEKGTMAVNFILVSLFIIKLLTRTLLNCSVYIIV